MLAAVGSVSLLSIFFDYFGCVAWFLACVESVAAEAADAIKSTLVAEITGPTQVFSINDCFRGLYWYFMAVWTDS